MEVKWIARKEGMRRPYCRRIYPASNPRMKMLEKLFLSPGRWQHEYDFIHNYAEKNYLNDLVSRQLVTLEERKEKKAEIGGNENHHQQRYCAITIPGVAYCIAARFGLSFKYTVYLAYLYVESCEPMNAFILAGGDAELAKRMVKGKAEYPYGILRHSNADRKFEGTNMFVLGTFVKGKGYCLNGLVPKVARHELTRAGLIRIMPRGTLIIPHEKYKELQKYDADLRAIVAWADRVCEQETAERMYEAAVIGRTTSLSNSGDSKSNAGRGADANDDRDCEDAASG